jgi:hypothetical protein
MSIKFDSVSENIRRPGIYGEVHDHRTPRPSVVRNLPDYWEATHEYHAIGPQQNADRVTPTDGSHRVGDIFECVISGTSGSVEPKWPYIAGWQVIDGTVTWRKVRLG